MGQATSFVFVLDLSPGDEVLKRSLACLAECGFRPVNASLKRSTRGGDATEARIETNLSREDAVTADAVSAVKLLDGVIDARAG